MMDQPKPQHTTPSKPDERDPKSTLSGMPDQTPPQHYVNITDMIRSLQRTEGQSDCFRRGLADCDQRECAWRQYCIEKAESFHPPKKP